MSPSLVGQRLAFSRIASRAVMDPRPIRPAKLHTLYGDDFDQRVIDGKWTSAGSPTSALAIDGSSWATGTYGAGAYSYQAAPTGDFTVTAALFQQNSGASNMGGLLVVDSSGNGVGITGYQSPDNYLLVTISAGSYGGSFSTIGSDSGSRAQLGSQTPMRIIKSGTSYTAQVGTLDGKSWSTASTAQTGPSTATRVGVGKFFGSSTIIRVDWFDLQ